MKDTSQTSSDERQNKINKTLLSLGETHQTIMKQTEMLQHAQQKIKYYLGDSVETYQEWFDDIEIFDKIKDGLLAIEHKFTQAF